MNILPLYMTRKGYSDEEIDADIDNRIRYFINQYGSKEEVEKIAGKSIYQLKEDFKENFEENFEAI